MAMTATNAPAAFGEVLARPFRAAFGFLLALSEAQAIAREAKVLFSLSDEELAARGLTRDTIGTYLTRNFAYL